VAVAKVRGLEHFEARIITGDDVDLTLPVKQLADRHGTPLTRQVRGGFRRRALDPVATAEEAKAQCEAAFGQQ
jgi:hypothetical protein